MSVILLANKLRELGITVKVVDGNLKLSGDAKKLTPPLIEELKQNKQELIAFLQRKSGKKLKFEALAPIEKKEYYPLASAQKRLYVLQQMEKSSITYNMWKVIQLHGEPDPAKLEQTFRRLIERHDSLRTSFQFVRGEPIQQVHPEASFTLEYRELQGQAKPDDIRDFIRPFDLSRAPLFRVGMLRTQVAPNSPDSQRQCILIIDMHHIVSDGISLQVLNREFAALHRGDRLPPLRIQYKDYSGWMQSPEMKNRLNAQQTYWLKKLEGELPVLNMVTDFPRPAVQSHEGDNISFQLDKAQTDALRHIARTGGSTVFMTILALYNILLAKLSGQEDIIVGSPVNGRRHNDLQGIIGMFVNTLPLRNLPAAHRPVSQFLKDLKQRTISDFENQEYPFEEMVENLDLHRDVSRNPIFDVMFTLSNQAEYQNRDASAAPPQPQTGSETESHPGTGRTAKFDLNLSATEGDKYLYLNFEFCTKLFTPATIKRVITYFKRIVQTVSRDLDQKIGDIEFITEEEKHQILYEFNDTTVDYPREKTIHQLFEEQAAKTPEPTAIATRNETTEQSRQLTYRELDEESNRLAHTLIRKGVQPGAIVAIMAERSIETIIGLLGILKAGGVYLPIDTAYPRDRIRYMLADSNTKILLHNDNNTANQPPEEWNNSGIEPINLFPRGTGESCVRPAHKTTQPGPAYIIYTSGTTGMPKGVIIEHRGLVDYVWWAAATYVKNEKLNFPLYTSLSFDLTVTSIFTPLITGNAIIVYGEADNPMILGQIIEDRQTGVLKATPAHLNVIKNLKIEHQTTTIKRIIVGGEELETALAKDIFQVFGNNVEIYNEYGPTETVVGSTIYKYDPAGESRTVPIGKPTANTLIYILDHGLKPVPVGVNGEIYIGGDGVARGYLNRPELTAQRFTPQLAPIIPPSSPTPYLYRTGDLARRQPDGNIEFLGRIDHQVKIRGFRIELGEIENCLKQHPDVREAVTLCKNSKKGDQYLCAYINSNINSNINTNINTNINDTNDTNNNSDDNNNADDNQSLRLKEHLAQKLPAYMVPTQYVFIDQFPLTPNGKIDKKALHAREDKITSAVRYVAPESGLEQTIAKIWTDVLKVEKVGLHDNFFDLGGNSLDLIKVNTLLVESTKKDIPIMSMFRYPSVQTLAASLTPEQQGTPSPIREKDRSETVKRGQATRNKRLQMQKQRKRR